MPRYSFDPKASVILVKATIQGPTRSHVASMILDTGACFTLIAPEILNDIGLDSTQAEERRTITTASGIEYVAFLKIPLLETMGVARKDLEVCVHSMPTNLPARGLLGLNFLRHFDLHLNFPQGYLELNEPL